MTKKRLLIADDDAVFLKLLTLELEQRDLNIEIAVAENGLQALQQFAETTPDMMLLDIRMPIEDGFSVMERLQKEGNTAPIFVLTHFRNDEYQDRAKKLGATGYLVKSDLRVDQIVDKIIAGFAA